MKMSFAFFAVATASFCGPVAGQQMQSLRDSDADRVVQNFIERKARCSNAEESFGWICGQTVQMPGNHFSEICTTKNEPFFSGALSLKGQSAHFLGQSFVLTYELPLEPLTPCKEWENPANPRNCAAITLLPRPEAVYGRFNESPPDILPEDLPSRPFKEYNSNLPTAFSVLDGEAVAFFYTRWIGEKPNSSPDACKLQTRLPEEDIGLDLTLPCDELVDWKDHLKTAVEAVKSRIVSATEGATCESLPASAVLLIEKHQSSKIDGLKKWLQQRE